VNSRIFPGFCRNAVDTCLRQKRHLFRFDFPAKQIPSQSDAAHQRMPSLFPGELQRTKLRCSSIVPRETIPDPCLLTPDFSPRCSSLFFFKNNPQAHGKGWVIRFDLFSRDTKALTLVRLHSFILDIPCRLLQCLILFVSIFFIRISNQRHK
jgi:hypothetical protein